MSQSSMVMMPGMSQSSMALKLTQGFDGTSLLSVQVLMMDVGLLFSLYVGWRLVREMTASARSMAAMLSVWCASSTAALRGLRVGADAADGDARDGDVMKRILIACCLLGFAAIGLCRWRKVAYACACRPVRRDAVHDP